MDKNFTRKIVTLSLAAILGTATCLKAQTDSKDESWQENKNMAKMNVPALLLNTFSFQYERAIGSNMSVAFGARLMPKSGIPYKEKISSWVDEDNTKKTFAFMKTSNFAFTPEVRFYSGKGVFRGFYVAPYLRFARFNAEAPFDFTIDIPTTPPTTATETIFFKGDINTFTGGAMIGAQWKLTKQLYLDWWIVGLNYGFSKGNLVGKRNLNAFEQQELRKEIDDFVNDIPLVKATYTVDSEGADIRFKGPWAGVRAGVNVGFRF